MTLTDMTEQDRVDLLARLPESAIRPLEPTYLQEPRGRYAGKGELLLAPERTEDVAAIIQFAQDRSIPVVPYGGGTGLVGGQIYPDGPAPIILSLQRMTRIRSVRPEENVLIAEAGAILQTIHEAADTADRLFPLTIAAKGSARIGGNLATNAGGVNVLRYGNARDLCLGLEAVLPTGEIWHGLSRLRKDNTGYDLRNLLIGSEGTLGVITAASLKLFPKPAAEGTALLAVTDPSAALALLSMARDQMGESITAFELIHRQGVEFLRQTMPHVRRPFDPPPDWTVLIEIGLARGLDPAEALETLFSEGLEAGLLHDGLVAQSETQRAEFWALRESLPDANRKVGSISNHDISVPLGALPDFIALASERVAALGQFRVNCFGHVGDGNLHYNVFPPNGKRREDFDQQKDEIQRTIHDLVHSLDGSVSAEHGIGRLKVRDLARYGDATKLAAMRAIKSALDPAGIMNPGVILPVQS